MMTASQQITNHAATNFTHSLAGRIRIAHIERIDKATGRSTRFAGFNILRNAEARQVARDASAWPIHHSPTITDGGLRLEVGREDAIWYVYSY